MLVVISRRGVHRCTYGLLHYQQCHQEAVQSGVARQSASKGSQHARSSGAQCSASMVSFMAAMTLVANRLGYTVSSLVVFATRPSMTASAGYASIALCSQPLGAACHRGVGARKRGIKLTSWRASRALSAWCVWMCRPGRGEIPLSPKHPAEPTLGRPRLATSGRTGPGIGRQAPTAPRERLYGHGGRYPACASTC